METREDFAMEVARVRDEFTGRISNDEMGNILFTTCTTVAKQFLKDDRLAHTLRKESQFNAIIEEANLRLEEVGARATAAHFAATCEMKAKLAEIVSFQFKKINAGRLGEEAFREVCEVCEDAALVAFDNAVSLANLRLEEATARATAARARHSEAIESHMRFSEALDRERLTANE